MARTFAKFKGAMWLDDEWCALLEREQRLYMLLVTQPQINNLGVLPLAPRRWSHLAADSNEEDICDTLAGLQQGRFVYCDWDEEELLVRTFIKHDRVADQPKLVTAAQRQFGELASGVIQAILAHEYPTLFTLSDRVSHRVSDRVSESGWDTLWHTPWHSPSKGRAREGIRDTGWKSSPDVNPFPYPSSTKRPGAGGKYTQAEMQASAELSRQSVAESREREGSTNGLEPIDPAGMLESLTGDAA